jgi:alcohol dehydrogenase class IV
MKMIPSVFKHPTKIIYGNDSLYRLEDELRFLKCKSLFVVSGKNFLDSSGTKEKLLSILKNFDIYFFNRVIPDPSINIVKEAVDILRAQKFDAVIGIGGGSPMDCAKLAAAIFNNQRSNADIEDYLLGKEIIAERNIPLIAIPTTAGTGSEVTPFVAIKSNDLNRKVALRSYFLYPDIAIVDPELTYQTPLHITASTSLDALSHAFESLWSKDSQIMTDVFAGEAIQLILDNIYPIIKNDFINSKKEKTARSNMSNASMFAGIAISQTRTGAAHAISYPIATAANITHGFACALTLSEVLKFNYPLMTEKFDLLFKRLNIKDVEEMIGKIDSLKKSLGAPCSLEEIGIKKDDIAYIAEQSFNHPSMEKNIADLSKKDIEGILKKIY